MPFSFLNPWLWLGALAIAAPIWLHLRRRPETNLLRFSALRFLDDQPSPRASPWRLQNLLLFAARALALLLLVAAFTWPYLRNAHTTPIRESRVYILDNTLSHQANDGFQHDCAQLLHEVGEAGPDLQVAVVELTASPRVVVSFGDSRPVARDKLAELQPSFQRGPYLAAFRLANSLLANSLGERRRIIFLGDNQENQWNEHLDTPPFLQNVQVELPKPAAAMLPNLSLSEPRAQRVFLGDKSLVNFTVKLTHAGPASTANVSVEANAQTVLSRTVPLDLQPDTILLQVQWEADPAVWVRGQATVDGAPDALAADNRVFFSLAPVWEGKVALLAQSPFLRLALSRDIMRGQWATRVLEPTELAAELLASQDADVLCLESSYLQSGDARKLLARYLASGRGVLLLVNRVTPAIDGCLRELGFESLGTVRTEKPKPDKFQFVFSNHPIFHPFLSPDYGNLLDIRVWQYARLKPSDALPLIFSERGAGLFFQSSKFPGKLFVAAFGLDREATSWPVHQTFVPFLDLALQAARADDPTPTTFEPGEVGVIQLPAGVTAHEIVLRGDRGEVARAPVERGKGQLPMPGQPGLYSLTRDDGTQVEKILSVNPSPQESRLAFVQTPEALRQWTLNRPSDTPRAAPAQVPFRLAGVLQQRLWWWMVLCGLGVLLLETALVENKRE